MKKNKLLFKNNNSMFNNIITIYNKKPILNSYYILCYGGMIYEMSPIIFHKCDTGCPCTMALIFGITMIIISPLSYPILTYNYIMGNIK